MKNRWMVSLVVVCAATALGQETLPPLADGPAPQTVEALWAGFDPRAEPLDVEVLKEWEQDGVVLQVLRYRIGVFKGQKAMMAAVYGYPKGGTNLPGLVQLHGGGQYAHYNACLTNAKRGYASISVSWAGRIDAPEYRVNPDVVKLFWEGKTNDPSYKLITDWGALDGYHAPFRYQHGFSSAAPHEHTLDAVESPRNDSWFLGTLGARRALTFLEQQPEVDGDRLGVYGHSMGGKLTVMTAGADDRVKAAAPSCGGVSHRDDQNPLIRATICDDVYLKKITCPIVFLSPANDFHGRIEDQQTALTEIQSAEWRVTAAAHHQHQDTAEYEVATQLWFDQYLMNRFTWPATPAHDLNLDTPDGVPVFSVVPDASREIRSVDFYSTQQAGEKAADRFWHHVKAEKDGERWTAPVPIQGTDKPLWVYANVTYALDEPVTGAGYYYGIYTTDIFNLSSAVAMVTPEQLQAAGVQATRKPSRVLEDFGADWEKEWYSYRKGKGRWERNTRKVFDEAYQAPAYSKLAFEVQSETSGTLIVEVDKLKAEVDVEGGSGWQEVVLFPMDFTGKEGGSLLDWEGVVNLRLAAGDGFPESAEPPFELRSLRWLEGTREERDARRTVRLAEGTPIEGKTYLDIESADLLTHGHKAVMNTWLDEKSPLVVDGTTYEHGLTTHADSEALYFLGGEFDRFRAIAQASAGATVAFDVYVDDERVFESGVLSNWQSAPIDLSLQGAQELKLVVTDGGNGKHGDHASWVDAHLTTAGGTITTTRVIVSDDFEAGIEKSPTLDVYGQISGHQLSGPTYGVRCMIPGLDEEGNAGAFEHSGEAAGGSKSLRLQDAPGVAQDFLPGLVWWLRDRDIIQSGTLRISFDLRIPEEGGNPLDVMVRELQVYQPLHLACSADRASLNGKSLPVAKGEWVNYTVTLPVGVADGKAVLTVVDSASGTQSIEAPLEKTVERIDWIAFLLPGTSENHLLLDNLAVSVENEMPDEGPIAAGDWEQDLGNTGWKAVRPEILDVFPGSGASVPGDKKGKTLLSSTYYPSGSKWARGLDERKVYHQEIKHVQDQVSDFTLRIGRGGQLYSLRGPFGESVPPQGLENPWNDEVWQFVAVCNAHNGTLKDDPTLPPEVQETLQDLPWGQSFFLHNSGSYMHGKAGSSFYCPLLGATASEDGRAYRTVNWGLVPGVTTIHRSPILYYVQTRDVGDGVIEMTYVVHNFSVHESVVFDHLNAPWGGTRVTSLPFHYLRMADGQLIDRVETKRRNIRNSIDVRETGGWNLSCASEAPDSPSLALVFGRDKNLEAELEKVANGEPYCQFAPSLYWEDVAFGGFEWFGQDWESLPENAFRNYEVAVVIPKFRLAPGVTIWYRSYLVVNRKDRAMELAESLVDKVDYGLSTFDPATTPRVPVVLHDGKVVEGDDTDPPAFELYAHPVPGTMPLFLIEHAATGREVVTTDPYVFHDKVKLDLGIPEDHKHYDYYKETYGYSVDKHNSNWKRLLGYGYVDKPDDDGFVQVGGLLTPDLFPEPDTFHLDLWVRSGGE